MARNPAKPLRPRKDKTIVKATSNLEETLGKFKYCVKGGAVYLSELQSGVFRSRRSLHTFQMAKDALQLGPSIADMEALGYIFRVSNPSFKRIVWTRLHKLSLTWKGTLPSLRAESSCGKLSIESSPI